MLDDDPGLILAEDLKRRNSHNSLVRFEDIRHILHADEDFYRNYKNNGMKFVMTDYISGFFLLALNLLFSFGAFLAFRKFWNVEFAVEQILISSIAFISFIFAILFLVPIVRLSLNYICLLYTSPSPRDKRQSRMPSSA